MPVLSAQVSIIQISAKLSAQVSLIQISAKLSAQVSVIQIIQIYINTNIHNNNTNNTN
jgi:hypothetical protein